MIRPLHRLTSFLCIILMLTALVTPVRAIEIAEELIVNLDAATFSTGDTTWTNSGTYVDFEAVAAPTSVMIGNAQGQTPAIQFDGTSDAFVGGSLEDPVPAPDGLVGFDPTRSIEVWALNPFISDEETLVSWGKRGGPDGTNMTFNYGSHGNFGAVGHWGGGGPDVGWIDNDFTPGAPTANQWHHLVYTYDEETARVYSDGVLWNEEDMLQWGGLDTHPDPAIAIASQWEADGITLTPALKGSLAIGRVRIHDGVLTPEQIAANYNEERGSFFSPEPDVPDPPGPIPSPPIHRYSFNEPAAADATDAQIMDSIGGAHGVVLGDGSSLTGTELQLDGGPSDIAAYVDLPNGLISSLTDATIETWVTIENAQGWSRIFDFGSNDPGGDDGELEEPGDDNGGNTEGLDYIMLSAERGTDTNLHRLEIRNEDPAGGGATTIDFTDVKDLPAEGLHYAVVYDADDGGGGLLQVYRNGELMNQGTTPTSLSDINDVNNWLGRSNWTNDANFEGSFDEFRIYDYALTEGQVRGNFDAGPNVVNVGGPSGDLNGDGVCDNQDIDLLSEAIRGGDTDTKFDLNQDGAVNEDDHTFMIKDLKNTWFGDADLNSEFGSGDLVQVFSNGKYDNGEPAGWADGDWNGDGLFGSGDLVKAFSDGGYELGPPPAAAVPEPTGAVIFLLAVCGALSRRRRSG